MAVATLQGNPQRLKHKWGAHDERSKKPDDGILTAN
jgi:hypothetical protein